MTESNKIPKHWQVKKLSDIGEIVSGGTPSTKVSDYWDGNISWISPADLSGYSNTTITKGRKSITKEGLKNSSARLIPKGSVLFSSRAPIGYVVIAGNEVCTNQGFKSIVPNKLITTDYLFFYLKASKQKAEKVASGTTFKEISLKAFSILEIPLPPLPEQQAIVSKIEELFSELDHGIAQLKTAKQQLKVYRQSLLKWAFEGKLTNKKVKDGELPKGWKWTTINEIGKTKGGKRLPPKHQYAEETTDFVYIMAGNLKDGTIKNKPTYLNEETYNALHNYKVTGGEVYITIVGACIGDAGVIPDNIGKSILTENAAKIIELKDVHNKFLSRWINSFNCQLQIKRKILSATLGKLALNRIGTLELPLPPLKEQLLIVDELESKLTVCDEIEETISQSLQQAETLRQSILKKAFEGKLVKTKP